jgi:high-affinity nickel-transport protein
VANRTYASGVPGVLHRHARLAAAVLALHLAGLLLLLLGPIGLGVGMTAYTLGLRHAFDADHIAAIDNTTRKLMSEGQRPLSVGFWFALGHSTIVFGLGLLVVVGVRGLDGAVLDDGSTLHQATGLVGPVVSGAFLVTIGLLNLALLISIVKVFRRLRTGELDERELEDQLDARGLMARFYGRATRAVRQPWHMYPLGLLFGLGFDTATEVALLVLAGGAAAGGMPFTAILCLPVLFAAGMALLDTIDGAFMSFAYGWAFSRPVRKIYYNMTITGLSVAVALLVGSVELLSVLDVTDLDLALVGYLIAGLFVLTWAIALAVWRLGRIEERWTLAARKG